MVLGQKVEGVKCRLRNLYLTQTKIFNTSLDRLKNFRIEWWRFIYWSERKNIFIEGGKMEDDCNFLGPIGWGGDHGDGEIWTVSVEEVGRYRL